MDALALQKHQDGCFRRLITALDLFLFLWIFYFFLTSVLILWHIIIVAVHLEDGKQKSVISLESMCYEGFIILESKWHADIHLRPTCGHLNLKYGHT